MKQITEYEMKQIRTEFNKRKKKIGLSGYNVGEYLTEGGTAKIYMVKNSFNLKQYVLRISEELPTPYSDEIYNEREFHIMDELRRSNLPHIVNYLDAFTVKVTGSYRVTVYYCAIMEYLIPLKKSGFVNNGREIAVRLGNDLLPLLQVLWDKKIIHRDIKPQNIFYDRDYRGSKGFMLGDFGIARKDSEDYITDAGTGSTKAPEIAGIDSEISGDVMHSDMYSLGMVMYYYLNECVYPSNHARLTNNPDKSPFPMPRYGSKKLKQLVVKATDYYPKNRFSTPQEMLRELQQCEEYFQIIPQRAPDSEETFVPAKAAADRILSLQKELENLQKKAAKRERELQAEINSWKEKYSQKVQELEAMKAESMPSPHAASSRDLAREPEANGTGNIGDMSRGRSSRSVPSSYRAAPVRHLPNIGDIIRFGHYPQDKNGRIMPLEWRVLDVTDDKALVITDKLIDSKKYNETPADVTWKSCTLCTFLNGRFYDIAFDSTEKSRILKPDNFSETCGSVFLLSIEEALQYFSNNDDRKAAVTPYAISSGSHISDKCCMSNGEKTGWWWLRSAGKNKSFAAQINIYGNVTMSGSIVNRPEGSIRPAMWISI